MKNLILKYMQDGVCTITLNNPSKKNAFSLDLLKELEKNLELLQNEQNLRSMILQGADGSFSVGADLSDVTGTLADQEIDDRIARVCKLLQELWLIRRLTTVSYEFVNCYRSYPFRVSRPLKALVLGERFQFRWDVTYWLHQRTHILKSLPFVLVYSTIRIRWYDFMLV